VCKGDGALRLVYEKHMIFVYNSFWGMAKRGRQRSAKNYYYTIVYKKPLSYMVAVR